MLNLGYVIFRFKGYLGTAEADNTGNTGNPGGCLSLAICCASYLLRLNSMVDGSFTSFLLTTFLMLTPPLRVSL